MESDESTFKLLLEYGADPNLKDNDGSSCFEEADED